MAISSVLSNVGGNVETEVHKKRRIYLFRCASFAVRCYKCNQLYPGFCQKPVVLLGSVVKFCTASISFCGIGR